MRTVPALFVVAWLALGASPVGATSSATSVTIVHAYGAGALVTWEPVPGADEYLVFRVEASGHATLVARTGSSVYFDPYAPDLGDLDYDIEVVGDIWTMPRVGTQSQGECIHTSSSGAASVTVKDCREAIGGD